MHLAVDEYYRLMLFVASKYLIPGMEPADIVHETALRLLNTFDCLPSGVESVSGWMAGAVRYTVFHIVSAIKAQKRSASADFKAKYIHWIGGREATLDAEGEIYKKELMRFILAEVLPRLTPMRAAMIKATLSEKTFAKRDGASHQMRRHAYRDCRDAIARMIAKGEARNILGDNPVSVVNLESRSCAGKLRLKSMRGAGLVVEKLLSKGDSGVRAYKCAFCEFYHVGHVPRSLFT